MNYQEQHPNLSKRIERLPSLKDDPATLAFTSNLYLGEEACKNTILTTDPYTMACTIVILAYQQHTKALQRLVYSYSQEYQLGSPVLRFR